MNINTIKYKGYDINYYHRKDLVALAKNIIDRDDLIVEEEYRNSDRSVVRKIKYNNEKLILKESKNEKRAIIKKIGSYFSKGESLITLININSFLDKRVKLYEPYVAIQSRKNGFIDESYLVTNFISDREARDPKYFNEVCNLIKLLHENGKAHGDTKLDNFLIDNDNNVVIIDTRLRGVGLLNLRKYYDYLNIKNDIKNVEEYIEIKKTISYYLALFILNFKKTNFFKLIRALRKKLKR